MIEIINGNPSKGQANSYFFAKTEQGYLLLNHSEYQKGLKRAAKNPDLKPMRGEWRRFLHLLLKGGGE